MCALTRLSSLPVFGASFLGPQHSEGRAKSVVRFVVVVALPRCARHAPARFASPAPFAGASGEAEKEKVAVGLVRFKIV